MEQDLKTGFSQERQGPAQKEPVPETAATHRHPGDAVAEGDALEMLKWLYYFFIQHFPNLA